MTTLTIKRTPPAGRASKGSRYAVLEGASQQELTHAERYAAGKKLRETCPRTSHAVWKPSADRPDPVELVLRAEKGRMPELLPLRHGRMVRSAFTFYRGSALAMAADLASTAVTGVRVQCCGDAHLCNFGGFATPERRVIFAINDLDETLPAPWEWDVKRLATSFVVACRDNGLSEGIAKDVVLDCVRSYRESMAEFSEMKTLEVWYQSLLADELVARIADDEIRDRVIKHIEKERGKTAAEDLFPKLVENKGERPVIKDQLPTIFHAEGHSPGIAPPSRRRTVRCSTGTSSGTLRSRWWGSEAWERPAGSCSSLQERAIRCFSRSRRRGPRSSNRTPAGASSRTTGSGWWTATGSCSPPATCSSGGPQVPSATTSCASSGT